MSRAAIVLWEDELGPRKGFGPADLLAGCIADVLGREPWDVARGIDNIPKKGNSKLLEACRDDIADLAPTGQPVFAVFDRDRIARLLGLPGNSTDQQIVASIRSTCPSKQLHVVLLKENVESLLKAAQACGASGSAEEWNGAIAGKEHSQRDALLKRLAFGPLMRQARDCVKNAVASFAGLVAGVAAVV